MCSGWISYSRPRSEENVASMCLESALTCSSSVVGYSHGRSTLCSLPVFFLLSLRCKIPGARMFLHLRNNFAHMEVRTEVCSKLKPGHAEMAGCAENFATLSAE